MTTATRIPPTEITGLFGAAVKLAARKMIGEVPDSIGVLWHHPAVMKDAMSIGRKVEGWKELDRHLATYAVMASAAYVGCSACLDLNYFMAHNHKLDELGPAALIELTARVAFINMSARMNITLGIRSEGFADSCGLPPLATRPADVGSPA